MYIDDKHENQYPTQQMGFESYQLFEMLDCKGLQIAAYFDYTYLNILI